MYPLLTLAECWPACRRPEDLGFGPCRPDGALRDGCVTEAALLQSLVVIGNVAGTANAPLGDPVILRTVSGS